MSTPEVSYRYSPFLADVLTQMQCSLLVSTGDAGKLIAIGVDDDQLVLSTHDAVRPTGIAAGDDTIAVASGAQISMLANNSEIAPKLKPDGRFDRVYLPREAALTGDIFCSELAWHRREDEVDELWLVNTRFSCLATLDGTHNFAPRWRPSFITDFAPDDRCHLSGLAMRDRYPAYATVFAQTNEANGWQGAPRDSGVLLDIATDEVVSSGLTMPYSPRFHHGRLLVLDSGHGSLEDVDTDSGGRTEIATFPGVTRGLACRSNVAFVGISRAGLVGAPADRRDRLRCGLGVVELNTGQTVATLEFTAGVDEVHDVQVLLGSRCISLGPEASQTHRNAQVWSLPAPSSEAGSVLPLQDYQAVRTANRGLDLQRADRLQEALRLLRRASNALPGSAKVATYLGIAMQEAGQTEGALAAYRRAVAADDESAAAHGNLGQMLVDNGFTDHGIKHLERSFKLRPHASTKAMIATALPVIFKDHGEVIARRRQFEESVRRLVTDGVTVEMSVSPVSPPFYSAYQGYNDRTVNGDLGRVYVGSDLTGGRTTRHGPNDRVRVGFISSFFRDHTIGRLNLGRVQHLDRDRFEITVLSTAGTPDPMGEDFKRAADRFVRLPRDVSEARELTAAQELDILFFTDVGMDMNTYAMSFSRMAPVQAVTWGHPVTTGSPTIDYFVSSRLLEVADADDHYNERLIRLPSLGTYYHRPEMPDSDNVREQLGIAEDAHLYSCPQTLFKFHPDNDQIFGEILRHDPKGILVLIEGRSAEWTRLLTERFDRSFGDVADRVVWLKPRSHPKFMAMLSVSDVALDPLVFGGGNSTYETLAVGTPVVTLPSEFLRGRISLALYRKIGFEELVCRSIEEYVEKAVRLACDADYRLGVVDRINETAPVLYEDESELRDLEAFFEMAVSESARDNSPNPRRA